MSTDLLALLAIIILSATLVTTLAGYLRLQKKARRLQDEEDAIRAKAHQRAKSILDAAQDAAFQIANDAVLTAEENRNLVQEKLEDVASKQLREYQKMVNMASGNIEDEISKNIQLKTEEAFKKVQAEIQEYKDLKEREIDTKIVEMVTKISKELIGKSIDMSTHTDLVIKALAQAKKEYGF